MSVSTEHAPSPQNDHYSVQLRTSSATVAVLQHATESFAAPDLASDRTKIRAYCETWTVSSAVRHQLSAEIDLDFYS